ncbi:glucose-6-phosphate dehydrogenase, partial [Alteromonas sp. AMM-1]
MVMDSSFEACDFVLFGTKGDLSRRKLLPSLYQLEKAALLHPDTTIIGVARQEQSNEDYVTDVRAALNEFAGETLCEETWERFQARLAYAQIDMKDIASYSALEKHVNAKRTMVCYLATPPAIYGDICRGLHGCNIIDSSVRLVLEKPIGHDLKSSKVINEQVAEYFDESQIYRIDHY